ncbi:MAG TPA: hypothetical protein VGB88_01610 [Alphaproteobacteria bacterium]
MTRLSCGIAVVLTAYAVSGCAFARPAGDERFSYSPPEDISEVHKSECQARARRAAFDRVAEMSDEAETIAILTGGLGAWLTLEYAASAEDRAYEETFKDCLREKGHDISE